MPSSRATRCQLWPKTFSIPDTGTRGEKQKGIGEKDLTGFAVLGRVTEEAVTEERHVFASALDSEPDRLPHVTLDESGEGHLALHGEGVCAIDLEDGVAQRQLPAQGSGASRRDVLRDIATQSWTL